jgi:hypothetical protein
MNNVDFDELLKQGVLCAKKMVPAYCTTDLSIFKENGLNRDIRPAKVEEFVYKLNHGQYMTGKPYIEVLPDLTLADGHHRIKAIKTFLAQKDCPVESVPVWFMVTEKPEYLHNCNTGGSMWGTSDHLKYYKDEGRIHYVYADNTLKEIKKQQKEMHIACKLGNTEILNILRGFAAGSSLHRVTEKHNHFEISNGELKILVKKEYILDILPYYKDIQTMPEYQNVFKTTLARTSVLTFLVVLHVFNCDMDYVVTKIMNIKRIAYVFTQHVNNGGIKEIMFNELGIRFKRKLFKDIGDLIDFDFSQIPDSELTFIKVQRLYNQLVHNGFFRPEGVWKQEELMNQKQ